MRVGVAELNDVDEIDELVESEELAVVDLGRAIPGSIPTPAEAKGSKEHHIAKRRILKTGPREDKFYLSASRMIS